jgi:hypothetical protein
MGSALNGSPRCPFSVPVDTPIRLRGPPTTGRWRRDRSGGLLDLNGENLLQHADELLVPRWARTSLLPSCFVRRQTLAQCHGARSSALLSPYRAVATPALATGTRSRLPGWARSTYQAAASPALATGTRRRLPRWARTSLLQSCFARRQTLAQCHSARSSALLFRKCSSCWALPAKPGRAASKSLTACIPMVLFTGPVALPARPAPPLPV